MKSNEESLFSATKAGDLDAVKQLLENQRNSRKIEVDAKSDKGLTALMMAAHLGHSDIAKLLIGSGANLDAKNDSGWTAIMAAAQNGFEDVVEGMISAGADVNEVDDDGWTALMRARQRQHSSVAQLLQQAGARNPPGIRMCEICGVVWRSPTGKLKDLGIMKNAQIHYGTISVVGLTCQSCGMSFCKEHLGQSVPAQLPGGTCPSCGGGMDVA